MSIEVITCVREKSAAYYTSMESMNVISCRLEQARSERTMDGLTPHARAGIFLARRENGDAREMAVLRKQKG